MNQITLELKPQPGNARNSEGAFVTLDNGRILFIWSKYITDSYVDEAPCILVSRTSNDGGLTWTKSDTPFSGGDLEFLDEDHGWENRSSKFDHYQLCPY